MICERVKVFDFPLECHTAYYFAKCKHDEIYQTRKESGIPYFVHPKGVALIVKKFGGTNSQINSALLHDTLEDTHTSTEELRVCFGEEVTNIVIELTNCKWKIEKLGKEEYMNEKLISLSDSALLVKLADILYNINDMPTEKSEKRMLRNVGNLILNRKDLSDNTRKLATMIIGN